MENTKSSIFNKSGRIRHDDEEDTFKIQTLLSKEEEEYLSTVGYVFRKEILSYKRENSTREVKKSYVNTTDVLLYLIKNIIIRSKEEDKGNIFKFLIEFENKEKLIIERIRIGILVKINSHHHHNLFELEDIISDNEFGLDIKFVSKFMQFVIHISKHYYLVLT